MSDRKKSFHDVLFEMLCDIDDLCRRHGIRYTLYCGTLLGAVRHQGFIPWDDDMDIAMPLEDYRRFFKIACRELAPDYEVQDLENTPDHCWRWMRVYKRGTTYIDKGRRNLHISHGIWLDIYPFLPAVYGRGIKIQQKLLQLSYALRLVPYWKQTHSSRNKMARFVMPVLSLVPQKIRNRISILLFEEAAWFGSGSPYVGTVDALLFAPKYLASEWEEMTVGTINGRTFPIPKEYDRLLTRIYGHYMMLPPESERHGHKQPQNVVLDTEKDYTEYLKAL